MDDTGSVYETEGSSVGRTILGTEATTTIAQVIMKDGENLDQVFQEKVLSVILILKPRSSSLPLRHSSSLPSTSSSSSQVGQKKQAETNSSDEKKEFVSNYFDHFQA